MNPDQESRRIEHVSDTALLVAACRAMETEAADGFVRDPFAARLAGERGYALAHEVDASKWLAFGIGMRSRFIDDLLLETIGKGAVDTVVNVGAGLDTRPWRLELPNTLRWIEVDFPDILAYKAERLLGERPKCLLETASADLNDAAQRRRALDRALGGAGALLMTEGLLTYLPGDTVHALSADTLAHPAYRLWLFDVISAKVMASLPSRHWEHFDRVRSETRLDGEAILKAALDGGWQVAASRRNMTDGVRMGYERIVRLMQEAAAQGMPRRDPPPPDDVSGVWLLSPA